MRELVIDLDAVVHNLDVMRSRAGGAMVMGVVKANGYGHGMIEIAKTLESAGVDYLGVADNEEALALREAGVTVPVLTWLQHPEDDFKAAVSANIDLGLSSIEQLERVAEAAEALGTRANVHLKVDTGLGRNGAAQIDWHKVFKLAAQLQTNELIDVVGMFTHLSSTSEHDDMAQIGKFEAAVGEARDAGLSPRIRHLTASDGSLSYPDANYEMVRVGAALYGLDPFSAGRAGEWGLRPVMTAKSSVVQLKRVEAGQGVSYGYLPKTERATTLALVPVGYAEGLPRDATRHVRVLLNNRLYPILARIAMDQFVLDVGDDLVQVGDEVVLFGDPRTGASSVDDFAAACSTINYEIVTRMGGRFKRVYVGGE